MIPAANASDHSSNVAPGSTGPDQWSPADVIGALTRHGRLLLLGPAVVAVLSLGILLFVRNRYTATAVVTPERSSQGAASRLADLAGLANMVGEFGGQTQSPLFYASLLQSQPIRYAVLQRKFSTAGLDPDFAGRDSARLVEILRPRTKETERRRLWEAARMLSRRVSAVAEVRTDLVRLSVTLPSPSLAAAVANAFVDELLRFNLETRQSSAKNRRIFLEQRVRAASDDLRAAEDSVRRFLEGNRSYRGSPSLEFELQRLERSVSTRQELYLQLRQQYESAAIAEVNDIPVLSIIAPAIPPERKSGPPRLMIAISMFFGTLLGATVLVALTERWADAFPSAAQMFRRWSAKLGPGPPATSV